VHKKDASTFTVITLFQSSYLIFSKSSKILSPALLINIDGVPSFCAASLILSIVFKSSRSPSTTSDLTEYSLTISIVFFASLILFPPVCINILKPWSANFLAVDLPIFLAPPVITATLSFEKFLSS